VQFRFNSINRQAYYAIIRILCLGDLKNWEKAVHVVEF